MLALALLLVLASGMTHALWNLFAKKSTNRAAFLWSIHLTAFVLLMPSFVRELLEVPLSAAAYGLMFASACIQGLYMWLLTKVYSYGDISQVYPFMRGLASLFVPVVSIVLFGESVSWIGAVGLGIIVAGLFALSGVWKARKGEMPRKAIVYSVLIGFCITGYTITDKAILQAGLSPIGLIQLSNTANVLALAVPALTARAALRQEWSTNWGTILLGSVFSPGSYVLFLFAMSMAPLAHIAPVREISTVFGTLLGIFILKERQGLMRICVSAMITCGIVILSLWG